MKFRLNKDTQLFADLQEVRQRMKDVKKAAKALGDKHGWEKWTIGHHCVAGGISGIFLDEKPEGWKLAFPRQASNIFFPKKTKANKALLEEIDNLPKVKIDELSKILGYGMQCGPHLQISRLPGIQWHEEYILFDVPDWANWAPDGGEEILVTEYKELE